jgi:hypothetical protein
VAKAGWLIAIFAVTATVVVGSFLLGPWSTIPSFSCTAGNVIDCATQGFDGIRGLFSGYFPKTFSALVEFLVIALGIVFISVLFYALKKSREEST